MCLKNKLTITILLISSFVHSQMNFKELVFSLNNRINKLISEDQALLNDTSYNVHSLYMFYSDTENLNLFLNNELPIDSLTPSLHKIETDTSIEIYLNTMSYILDHDGNLLAYGDARKLIKISDDFGRNMYRRELINILINPENKMVMMLGIKGIRLGYYVVIKDDGFLFYKGTKTGMKELSKEEYLEILSETPFDP
jgi:hypothetical protein